MCATTSDGPQLTDPQLTERLREIRERLARRLQRTPPASPELRLPELESLKEGQAGLAPMADGIGTVNPRPPGLDNDFLQSGKRSLARLLDWLLRPQREFNRKAVESFARTTEILEETNKNLAVLAEAVRDTQREQQELREDLDAAVRDTQQAQQQLAQELREKLDTAREGLEEKIRQQRWDSDGALVRRSGALQDQMFKVFEDLQEQFWGSVEQVHEEFRQVRQRMTARAFSDDAPAALQGAAAPPSQGIPGAAGIDYFQLERSFRGTEEDVRSRQSFYLPFFQGRKNVLDIACGRGEFLELMRSAGVPAKGVDANADMVGRCREKGLAVMQADAFAHLDSVPDGSLDGVFCAHFVEHMPPDACAAMVRRCAAKLAPGGVLAVETPNPECLAIFSQTFFLDPTHVRPVPPALLRFLLVEAGLGHVETHFLSPASAQLPVIPALDAQGAAPQGLDAQRLEKWNAAVARFNETFFGGMDYAVIGTRPAYIRPTASGRAEVAP